MRKSTRQNGNALFLILIAIFLLGGLTVLLTRTSGQTEETGSTERASIKASEMLRYTAGMAQAVNNLLLNGNCSETDISFYTTEWSGSQKYNNTNTPVANGEFGCHVFNPEGAGYAFKRIPAGLQATQSDYFIGGRGFVHNVGSNALADLILIAPNLTVDACRAINKMLGVQNFAKDGLAITSPFVGVLAGGASGGVVGDDNTHPEYVAGKKAACLQSPAWGGQTNDSYYFYQVLIAR